jgi:hypothetical protein
MTKNEKEAFGGQVLLLFNEDAAFCVDGIDENQEIYVLTEMGQLALIKKMNAAAWSSKS